LPYEWAENKESWDESWKVSFRLVGENASPAYNAKAAEAKILGMAMLLDALATGCDDEDLIAADPPWVLLG
jgi:hypothetical protein